MNVLDAPVCFLALAGTIFLSVWGVRLARSRKRFLLGVAVFSLVVLHFVGYHFAGPSMHDYMYFTAADPMPYKESVFKIMSYDDMLSAYHKHGGGAELYRGFRRDWWNYYRWRDYATHPRLKLRYRHWELQQT